MPCSCRLVMWCSWYGYLCLAAGVEGWGLPGWPSTLSVHCEYTGRGCVCMWLGTYSLVYMVWNCANPLDQVAGSWKPCTKQVAAGASAPVLCWQESGSLPSSSRLCVLEPQPCSSWLALQQALCSHCYLLGYTPSLRDDGTLRW